MLKLWTVTALVSGLVLGASLTFGQVVTGPGVAADEPETAKPAATSQAAGGVNLDLDGAGAEEAFDKLAKQVGVDLVVNDQQLWFNADPIFIKVKDGRFWPTFMEMCKQARITFNADAYGPNRGRSIQLYNNGGGGNDFSKLPQTESEGFIIMAQSAQRSASVQYDHPENANSSFFIQLRVFVDPSLNVLQMSQPTVSEAVDENGLSLVGAGRNNNGMYYGNNMGSLVQNLSLPLAYPSTVGKKIAKVKGYLRATATVKSETIEMNSPLTATTLKKEFPDYDITLQPLKAMAQQQGENQPARYEMKLTIRTKQRAVKPGGIRREMRNDFQNLINAVVLSDAEGHRLNNNGWGGGGGNGMDIFEYTLNFQAWPPNSVGQPAKLTWSIPVETKEIRVPFELKDLVIP